MRGLLLGLALFSTLSCAARRPMGAFRILPATPEYLLQSPDSRKTPFPETLRQYNGFEPGGGWMDLHPWMELSVENAYYQEGAPKRGLTGFLGTEIAEYEVRPTGGLRLVSVHSMKDRPRDQPPVQQLIPGQQRHYRYHRFYFEILFKRNSGKRGSVLLGANSTEEVDRLATQLLTEPESICAAESTHCTVFPELCSVSVEMKVIVNGAPRTILWRSPLASIVDHPRHVEVLRLYAGHLTPIAIDAADPNALRLPLLPGDHIEWK